MFGRFGSLGVVLVVAVGFIVAGGAHTGPAVANGNSSAGAAGIGNSGLVPLDSNASFVDLLGQTVVSPTLVYNGYYGGMGVNVFPILLTGDYAKAFWGVNQSILEMAPSASTFTSGMALGSVSAASQMTVNLIGASSTVYNSGDGLEAYLFVSPLNPTSWSAPYYATFPGGLNGSFENPQGSVMFPYSTTDYIAIQWDPAYGISGDMYIYLVSPGTGGVVTTSSFVVHRVDVNYVGTPSPGSYIALSASYNIPSNYLTVTVTDRTNDTLLSNFSAGLSTGNFHPGYSVGTNYYFGAGGSGNSMNGWGILSLSVTGSTPATTFPYLEVALIAVLVAAAAIFAIILVRRQRKSPTPKGGPNPPNSSP